jgi:hypothetical protein
MLFMFFSSTYRFVLKSGHDHFDPHLGYRLDKLDIETQFLAEAKDVYLLQRAQIGSGPHPATYSKLIGSCFRGGKAARTHC